MGGIGDPQVDVSDITLLESGVFFYKLRMKEWVISEMSRFEDLFTIHG